MKSTESITSLLLRLWCHLTPRRRGQFGLLLILMVLASFAEVVSIGAVLPFLAALTAPEKVFQHAFAQPIVQALKLTRPEQLLLPLTIAIGSAALIAGAMRLLLLWASSRLSFSTGADLGISIYRRTLYQPYTVHCARNSSEVINGVSTKASDVIAHIVMPLLTLASTSVMATAILLTLFYMDPLIAFITFGAFGLIYAVILGITRARLLANSRCIASESTKLIKYLSEGLGGIRDIILDGTQDAYCDIYRKAETPLRRAQCLNHFISQSPRYGMEALGMVLIAALAYALIRREDGLVNGLPVLGALAVGAQRLLPLLQHSYWAVSGIRGGHISFQDTIELLEQPLPSYIDQPLVQPLPFKNNIRLKNLGFRYSNSTPYVLRKLDLTITKGSRVGFVGTTGSGKSTLLDIVMGLLQPTEGSLEVDDEAITPTTIRGWQAHIAHVPQAIFLADSTIEENIAFGLPIDKIDQRRVREAARQAQIADSIEAMPKQYQTLVGEHGIRLSGGQRQRIGIARALYKNADVIIFDEATSALDSETEQAVMKAIENLSQSLTLLIIAHRLSTLKSCTQIVELGDGGIKREGSYEDIVNN